MGRSALSCVTGRFQPVHRQHLELFLEALALSERLARLGRQLAAAPGAGVQGDWSRGLGRLLADREALDKAAADTRRVPRIPQGMPIADVHGLWFPAGNGLVLYANGEWYPMSSIGGQLAGQCA